MWLVRALHPWPGEPRDTEAVESSQRVTAALADPEAPVYLADRIVKASVIFIESKRPHACWLWACSAEAAATSTTQPGLRQGTRHGRGRE